MKRLLVTFCLLMLTVVIGCNTDSAPQTITELKEAVDGRLEGLEGDFAVAFKSLDNSRQTFMINGREMFHAASTMKTPVMVEIYKQGDAGKFSLDDSIMVKNSFRSIVDSSMYQMDINEDSEGALYHMVGQQRRIRDLMNDMITMSSNLATNILIEKVGARNVT